MLDSVLNSTASRKWMCVRAFVSSTKKHTKPSTKNTFQVKKNRKNTTLRKQTIHKPTNICIYTIYFDILKNIL